MKAPPGGGITAEGLAFVGWVAARTRLYVEDTNLEDVARFRTVDRDWAGTDVDAKPFARPAII